MNRGAIQTALGHNEWRSARKNENNVFIDRTNRTDELLLRFAELHMQSIHTLKLEGLVKTNAQKQSFGIPCDLYRLVDQLAIGGRCAAVKALSVGGDLNTCGKKAAIEAVELRGIDLRRACALIARKLRKIADNGHPCKI